MSGTKRIGFGGFICSEVVIFILAIQGSRLVISTTSKTDVPSSTVIQNVVCEGNVLTIECVENRSIHILYANYGRNRPPDSHGQHICDAEMETNCSSSASLSKVRELCENQRLCRIEASNDVFNGQCADPYLEVEHSCRPVRKESVSEQNISYTVYACEHSILAISCKENESLNIVYANYGRIYPPEPYGQTACGVDRTKYNISCSANYSLSIVRDLCSGKSNCSVFANNSIFGEPCAGIKKYLKVIHQCHSVTKAKRLCGSKAEWNRIVDLGECVSKEILALQNKLKNLVRNFSLILVHELMDGLERAAMGDDLHGRDLVALAKIMGGAIALIKGNGVMNLSDADSILQTVVNTTSMLLHQKNTETWRDLPKTIQSSTATRLLWSVESSSAILANSISERKNLKLTAPGLESYVYALEQSTENSFSKSYSHEKDKIDYLSLKDIMPEAGLRRVTVALFDVVGHWLHVNESATKSQGLNSSSAEKDTYSEAIPEIVVNTRVMSISIISSSRKYAGLKENVRYTMEHKQEKSNDSGPVCVFWKYSEVTFEGYWSGEGCRDVTNCSNCSYTVCECDHLTNFAVLMSVSGNKMSLEHVVALSSITYIGCIISIICLALAFITFCSFKDLQCVRNTVHKNLVLCLFISEVIFLFGIGQRQHEKLCVVVAGFLHYFFLASFSWMFLEGVQLYILLVKVFDARPFRLRWYYLCGYGTPALVVFISALATYGQGNNYAAEYYCWLSTDGGLIWAFTGPVLVIVLVNSVVLVVAIYTMYKSKASSLRHKQESKTERIVSWVRGAVVLMVLLGSTWAFGFLYLGMESLFMAYIFTILNSLQGLFIFVFHCLTCEKVQKEYRRCIQRCTWLPGIRAG